MNPNLSMGKLNASLIVCLLITLMTKLHAGATLSLKQQNVNNFLN